MFTNIYIIYQQILAMDLAKKDNISYLFKLFT